MNPLDWPIFDHQTLKTHDYYVNEPRFLAMMHDQARFPKWIRRKDSDFYYTLLEETIYCFTLWPKGTSAQLERLNADPRRDIICDWSHEEASLEVFPRLPEILMEAAI